MAFDPKQSQQQETALQHVKAIKNFLNQVQSVRAYQKAIHSKSPQSEKMKLERMQQQLDDSVMYTASHITRLQEIIDFSVNTISEVRDELRKHNFDFVAH